MSDIRFTDLADELGITNIQLSKLRDAKCAPGDYYVKDNRRWFTEAGADKLRLAKDVPLAVPDRIGGWVVRAAPNPRWVYAELDSEKGKVVPVAIPRRLHGRLIGKRITVDIIKDAEGGVSYRHESLGN